MESLADGHKRGYLLTTDIQTREQTLRASRIAGP